MPFCNTYGLTLISLTLDEEYLLTTIPPDLERGVAPLGPPAPAQPLTAPWTWDSSSPPFLRCRSLALSAAAPDLGRGVAPLGRA